MVCLWCGRTVGRTVTLLPIFLGWVDYHISLAIGLRQRALRARLELRYKPDDFGKPKSIELHSFSNASISGYGQCSYVRMVNDQQKVHCSLVMAKSRVTPLKPVNVPRLELTAALVSTKISAFLRKELKYDCVPECFWTESKVVLGYISKRLLLTEYRGFVITPHLTNGTTLTPKTTQQTMHQEVEELEN